MESTEHNSSLRCRYYVKTLGCKVNSFDTHALQRQLNELGLKKSSSPKTADVAIINSCSVTAHAEKEARYLARSFKRKNPKAMVVVTGCYAQTDSAALAAMDEVDFIIPNALKDKASALIFEKLSLKKWTPSETIDPQYLTHKLAQGAQLVSKNKQLHFKSSATLFDHPQSSQTRVFLKIQDGCNGFCSYCLIPYARGASRSVTVDQVLDTVETSLEQGTKEIILTGIHIGDYGRDLSDARLDSKDPFADLLRIICQRCQYFGCRLRISSLEPMEVSKLLLAVLEEYRNVFCDHFHLPLQSGSDAILCKMRRQYTTEQYAESVHAIRRIFPQASIGADVIPGFPGETETDFNQTMQFIKDCSLSYLHVFPYSRRPNTAALRMPHHLDPSIIHERARQLRDLSKTLEQTYGEKFVNQEVEVIWLNDKDPLGRCRGLTRNYLRVVAAKSYPEHQRRAGQLGKSQIVGLAAPMTYLAIPAQ